MSGEQHVTSGIFVDKTLCPVCNGAGCVDCCQTGDIDCVPIPCDYCGGKGVLTEVKKGRIGLAVVIVAVLVVAVVIGLM